MANSTEIIETLEKNYQLELTNVKICQEKEKELKNPGAKLMLYQIRMDSTKHAHILKTLIDIIKEGTPALLWDYRVDRYIGQAKAEDTLREHADLEKEMIQSHEKMMNEIDDPGIKKILKEIVEDEKRHHKVIMDVIQQLLDLGP
ncbi:MAG: ferritin family protein [Candidatus Hodarchaeota archaeon]